GMPGTSSALTAKLTPWTACAVASRLTKRDAGSWSSTSRALPLRRSGIGRLAVARARIEHVAGRGMRLVASRGAEHRVAGVAHRLGERAARMKPAARRGVDRVGWVAGDRRLLDSPRRVPRGPRPAEGP